ncbi:hypothetical protein EG329_008843 [Mollisiaceae sp. DMI_Dod_QoI]|nr:hypothetical protein EG329_008843 [Helotiales sp. DMI_Dod_QoI]
MSNQENPYAYSKIIQSGIIRLILLQPSEDLEAELCCSLIDASLKDYDNDVVDHYVALSYVWGDATQKGSICVDGRFLEITASLQMALCYADGICINQLDVDDRNTQVAVMGSIYATARHTIIFLGPSNPMQDSVLETISGMNRSEECQRGTPRSAPDDILGHPWFSRVWILQELVLSPDPWVQSGRVRVRWEPFWQGILSEISGARSDRQKLLHSMVQIRFKWHARKYVQENGDTSATIYDILKVRRGMGVSDPRDMIYAHLGLSEPLVRSNIVIDYSKSKAQVYEDIARYFFGRCDDLSFLAFVENTDLRVVLACRPGYQIGKLSPKTTFIYWDIDWKVIPGVLMIKGTQYGTVMCVVSQKFVPRVDIRGPDVYDRGPAEYINNPENTELIRSLLTYSAYHYNVCVRVKHPRFRLQDSSGNILELMEKCIAQLHVTTRQALEEASANPLVLLEFIDWGLRFIFDIVSSKFNSEENRVVLIQNKEFFCIRVLPSDIRVGDILGLHSSHQDLFIFRPHEERAKVAYDAMVPKWFDVKFDFEGYVSPLRVICCKFIAYAPIFDKTRRLLSSSLGEIEDQVVFAIH